MYEGQTVFAQLMEFLPRRTFQSCIRRYNGHHKMKSFTCREQYLAMAFAQLTWRKSLRDIETCLRAQRGKLYHMGFKSAVSRSTLADANAGRDWRIYGDLAQALIGIARPLYRDEPFGVELAHTVYALDATTIDLCLSVFPWASFRSTKAAVKLHTLLDLRGNIPTFIRISNGTMHDVQVLDELIVEAGAFYVMDRGYIDFFRLHALHQRQAFFVTRAKRNMAFRRRYSRAVDKTTGVRSDQTIVLTSENSLRGYPEPLRRIRYYDADKKRSFVFLTNNFTLSAVTIAQLYKCRWQVELFFKWIKQHLRINSFFGTTENAVKTQVWIAVSVYVLIAIMKKRLKLEASLYSILQILSVTLFEKVPINQALSGVLPVGDMPADANQLILFE
jgi:hypothetical protein